MSDAIPSGAITALPIQGTPIVATATNIAPLTDANGAIYEVQVRNGQGGLESPANAASWNHNSDDSLDVFDVNGNLVASYHPTQWWNVQLSPLQVVRP